MLISLPTTVEAKNHDIKFGLFLSKLCMSPSRVGEVYPHNVCTPACKDRGCGKVFVCDGHWKTAYPICMFSGTGVTDDFLPNVCTSSPEPGTIDKCVNPICT